MVLSIGTRFVCFLYCFFNLVIWILGCIVLAVGIFVCVESKPWRDVVNLDLTEPSIALIIAGTFVMVLGFCGCCGACIKGKCCLICYSIIVFLIVALEVAAGVYVYKKPEVVEKKIFGALVHGLRDHYARRDHSSMSITIVMDLFQEKLKCCGAMGPDDYHNTYWQNNTAHHRDVPDSCCRKQEEGCNVNVTIYKQVNVTFLIKVIVPLNNTVNTSQIVNGTQGNMNGTQGNMNGTQGYMNGTQGYMNGTQGNRNGTLKNRTVWMNTTKLITVHTYNGTKIYNNGCVELGVMWAQKNILLVRNVGIGIGVTELVGILAALCLWYNFKHEKKGKRKPGT